MERAAHRDLLGRRVWRTFSFILVLRGAQPSAAQFGRSAGTGHKSHGGQRVQSAPGLPSLDTSSGWGCGVRYAQKGHVQGRSGRQCRRHRARWGPREAACWRAGR